MDSAKLYSDFVKADKAFSAELTRLYGKEACNRRYDADSTYPLPLQAICRRFKVAGDCWRDSLPHNQVQSNNGQIAVK